MLLSALFSRLKNKFPDGFVNNVVWQYLSSILTLGLGFAYIILLGRYLGKSEFGLFSLVLSSSTLVFSIFELRLHETVQKYVAEHWELHDKEGALAVIYASLILDFLTGFLGFIALIAVSSLLQEYILKDVRGSQMLLLCGFSILFGNIGSVTATGVLRVFNRYKLISMTSVGGAFLKLLVLVLATFIFHVDLFSIFYLAIICSITSNLILIGASLKYLSHDIPLNFHFNIRLIKKKVKMMFHFILSNYFVSVFEAGFKELDTNMLGALSSVEMVASYRVAKTFSLLVAQVTAPIGFVMLSEFSKLYVKSAFKQCELFVRRISLSLLVISLMSLVGSLYVVPILIGTFLGSDYTSSISVFFWAVLWVPIGMPLMWTHPLACAANRPNLYLVSTFLGNFISILLYYLLIPQFAASGAAFSYSAGLSFTAILSAFLTWNICISRRLLATYSKN